MTASTTDDDATIAALSEEDVIAYLRAHPDCLANHAELLETLALPKKQMGKNVLDFQHYAVTSLQQNMQDLKDKFNGLLSSARDNLSVQQQVHQAVLQICKARDLEQLLETLTIDFLNFFDVDAVRLVIESEIAELYESTYGDLNYSGISFVPLQTVDLALGVNQPTALVSDSQEDPPYAYEAIFIDCAGMVKSCALLRIHLNRLDRPGILAFGVREKGRFHPHQGVELLRFLSDIVELRLDQCLNEYEIEKLL